MRDGAVRLQDYTLQLHTSASAATVALHRPQICTRLLTVRLRVPHPSSSSLIYRPYHGPRRPTYAVSQSHTRTEVHRDVLIDDVFEYSTGTVCTGLPPPGVASVSPFEGPLCCWCEAGESRFKKRPARRARNLTRGTSARLPRYGSLINVCDSLALITSIKLDITSTRVARLIR